MAVDIASALGIGSGINTTQLVSDLVSATRTPKETAINNRASTNNARISALASAKSSLATFSSALTELLKSSDYSGQPVSNDPSIATVSLLGGGTPTGLPAQLEVKQLASAQVLQSATLAAATAAAGTGTLTLSVGGASVSITLASPANTLADLANAINAKDAGVTASVMTDKDGARLVLKGKTGADQAFTLTAEADADADLQRFTFNGTIGSLTRSQQAKDALVALDNVDMRFATNDVTTAIPYLRIDLNKAEPGTTVTIATNQPTSSMRSLVEEFVSAYNTFKTALNTATQAGNGSSVQPGVLSSDSGVREMSRRLAALTSTPLAASGPYRSLTDIGVRTSNDGTLTLDSARLDAALKADPAAVTQMLNPTQPDANNPGIAGALKSVTDYLGGADGPLSSSQSIYDKLKTSLQDQLDKLDTDMGAYKDQLTKTYAAMQAQLATLKATQSYIEQQVKVWTNSN